jgi:hypothetical protein
MACKMTRYSFWKVTALGGITLLAVLITYWSWEYRSRKNILEAVDVLTGSPLPVYCDLDEDAYRDGYPGDDGNPFTTFSFWQESDLHSGPNFDWDFDRRCPLSLIVSSSGYRSAKIYMDARSPARIVVPLHKVTAK